jgi:PTS system nitrogen regulatory IIA component
MPSKDFDIESLAAYLHLTPAQVAKMAERGRLPGRKIGGQWRFSEAEIHHWLEQRIGLSDDEELERMENVLDRRAGASRATVCIADLLPLEAIAVPLAARTHHSVIDKMSQLAAETGRLWDPEKMAAAVRDREELHPTALDIGVALLHPRRPLPAILAEPVLALGRTHQGLPFGGERGNLTDIFILICSTDDQVHLRTLARLSRLLSHARFLEGIRAASDAVAAHEWIAGIEAELFGE